MLLAINIGNTNVSLGIFDKDVILGAAKVKTHDDKFKNALKNELGKLNINTNKVTGVIIGSVVPDKTELVISILNQLNFPKPLIVNSKMRLPVKFAVDNPEEVGADLIANLTAGVFYKLPLVIIDSGTATTFCMLSKDKEFTGAIIAPGLEMLSKSLSDNTALLPGISVEKPKGIIGKNTTECIRSGVYWGYIGLVQGIVDKIKDEYKNIEFIGTGGNIDIVAREISGITIDQHLTLKGLNCILSYGNKTVVFD